MHPSLRQVTSACQFQFPLTHCFLISVLWLSAASVHAQQQAIATQADFRGLAVSSKDVAWVSGTQGAIGRTSDGGKHWQVYQVPGAEQLDFRDIEAINDTTAYVLSIGPGEKSRIYKTVDAGKSWKLQFTNADPDAFYDAIAFWDEEHGIALSDPVKGHYRLLATDDGGQTWKVLPTDNMPAALAGEGAFAASGTCLITQGAHDAWFVTGGGQVARVFHSTDRGKSWTVTDTPILDGKESTGIFSIAWKNGREGMIVGGDYMQPHICKRTAAQTHDGGKTWTLLEQDLPFGSYVCWNRDRWWMVGSAGTHYSTDGIHWKQLNQENLNVAGFAKTGEGWAAGPRGRIWRLEIGP